MWGTRLRSKRRFCRLGADDGRQGRKSNDELASRADATALRLDVPAVKLHYASYERQPDTEPALRSVECAFALAKEIEYPRQQILSNADSIILDRDDRYVRFTLRGDGDRATWGGVLRSVGEKVSEYLFETLRIRVQDDLLFRQGKRECMASFDHHRLSGVDALLQYPCERQTRPFQRHATLIDAS